MLRVLVKGSSRFPISRKVIYQAVSEVLNQQGISGNVEVSVRIGGDRLLKSLNRQYRQLDETADVLSFSQQETGDLRLLSRGISLDTVNRPVGFVIAPETTLYLGDVVVSFPQAREAASRENTLVENKIAEWVQHGVKHLLGEHH